MENKLKRFLSLFLALTMIFGMIPTNVVFAEESSADETSSENSIEPSEQETPEPEASETGTSEQETSAEAQAVDSTDNGLSYVAYIDEQGYETIDAAIDEADDYDVITITEGTHNLTEQLVIDKAVTIQGAGVDSTILNYTVDDGSVAVSITGSGVTMKGLTVNHVNTSDYNSTCIALGGSGNTLDTVKFTDGRYALSMRGENLTVQNCTFGAREKEHILIYTVTGTTNIVNNDFGTSSKQYILVSTDSSAAAGTTSGTMNISGNKADELGQHFFNYEDSSNASGLTLNIENNRLTNITGKAVVIYGSTGAFSEITVTGNVMTRKEGTDTSLICVESTSTGTTVNASGNYFGSDPDLSKLVVNKSSDDNTSITVENYYNSYDAETGELTDLISVSAPAYIAFIDVDKDGIQDNEEVGYATIDEAIAAWTNGTTLTLLSDVTLSDVIQLSSTEYHILDLGTYTMTAASGKDAIQIVNNGRSSAGYALDIKADATNPGGITATGKAIVRTAGKSGVKDRPIIRFYGGVFNASYIVYHSGSNGTNCPQFQFHGGEFNGTIYTNRTLNQFYGGTFNGSLMMSVDSSAYTLISGGTFKQLSNLYMSALNSDKFTIGSKKGVYDREVYIDDNGNYVVAAAEPAEGIEAAVAKTPGTNDYLAYSKVATEGQLNYTDVYTALEKNQTATVTVYADELDLEGSSFTGTIVVPAESTLTITNAPETLVVTDTEGNVLTANKGTYSTVQPDGSTVAYLGATGVWGENWTNACVSQVYELYEGETKIATSSLNNVNGIIDGDVYVTWSIPFAGSTDEYWTVEWAEGYPKYDMNMTEVALVVDGKEVCRTPVQFNGPDNLNPIVALAEDNTGGVQAYTSLTDAIGNFNGRKVNVLCDVTESIEKMNGATLTTNVEDGVTITTTYTSYVYSNDLNIGENVTVNAAKWFFETDSVNTVEGTLIVGEGESGTFYHGYDAKTTIQNGGKVIVNGTTILRYNQDAEAGLYIYGDGDDSTVEFSNAYYIGAYSGTFYAEDANIETGYFLLKNSYDNSNYADIDMTLDNSSLKVVGTSDTQDSFIIDDQASLTLVNGASIEDVRDFNILAGANLTLTVDETSSISATNVSIAADVPFTFEKNEDGTVTIAPKTFEMDEANKAATVYNADGLKAFADAVNGGNTFEGWTVKLAADIDLAAGAATYSTESSSWTPIGNSTNKFQGTFDGQGHIVSNLVITGNNSDVGLFGFTTDGEIKNLTVNNANVSGYLNVGVVAGTPYTSKYTNINVTGRVEVNGYAYVGGVGGKNAYADWTDITVNVDSGSYVKAESENYRTYVGGVIGFNGEGSHTFKNISSNIKVIGSNCDIGGIFGIIHYNNKVENVSCSGNVVSTGEADELGGIAGVWHNKNGTSVTMTNVAFTGTVSDVNGEVEGVDIVGGAYTVSNDTPANSGSLIIDGKKVWPVVAKIGDAEYGDLQYAVDAAVAGDTIALQCDVTLIGSVSIEKAITLDLGGYTITATDTTPLKVKADVTIDNGTVNYSGCDYGAICTYNDDVDLTLGENLTVTATNDTVLYLWKGTAVTSANLICESTEWAAIMSHGNYTSHLTINGGTITATNNLAIYWPCDGKLTVNGGTITGTSAIDIKSGSLEITNGTLIGTGNAKEYTYTPSGWDETGDAVIIENIGGETGYEAITSVSISGGTFKSENASAVASYAATSANEQAKPVTGFISGGTFSSAVDADYCAEGYVPKDNGDGTYGVKAAQEAWIFRNGVPKFYGTLAEAIADAKADETVILCANVTVSERISIDKNLTISDYGALTISFVGNGGISVLKDAEVTLDNLNIDISGAVATGDCIIGIGDYSNNGKLTLNKVNMTGNGYSSAYAVFYVYNTSELNINGGSYNLSNDKASAGGFIKAEQGKDGIVNITDAVINLTDAKIGFLDGTVELDGVTLNIKGGANAINQSALTVIDSTITVDGADGRALTLSQGNVTIQNSTLNFSNCSEGEIRFKKALVLTVDENSTIAECDIWSDVSSGAKVNDTEVTGTEQNMSTIVNSTVTNPDWAAKIGTTYYMTLAEAFAAGGEVVLVRDIDLSESVAVANGKIVTLDLNGKTITGTDNTTVSFGLINIQPGAELTINDSSTDKTGKITLIATNDRDWNAYSSVISNQRGKLTVNGGTIEHLGGTDMAYGIDNLTNGKGTYAETIINGGTIKSTYRAIRQFLNGVEAQNILTVNGGTIEGANKSIWMQDPSKNANTGTLTVGASATLNGDVYLFVTAGSTEWPVEVSIASAALSEGSQVLTGNVPNGYEVVEIDGVYGVKSGEAKIGTTYYDTLAQAFNAAQPSDEVKIIKAGTYELSTSGKNLTITGAVDGVVFDNIGAKNMGSANVTFNNVTFDYYPNVNYTGLQHSGNLVYNNCTFNGQVFLYGTSETFNKCTFNQTSADAYNVWTYGAKEVAFTECTFNSAGKSVLIYAEGASISNDVTVTDCDFIASASVEGKAAIEMDSSLTAGITLTIDAATTATGFGNGSVSGNSLWNNKKGNEGANNDITVTVNNEVVLQPVQTAQIGNLYYTTLQAAMAAAKDGDTVTIFAGDYTGDLSVNKDITVIGETDAEGNNLVNISGKLNITADGATVKNINVNNGSSTAGYISAKDVLVEGCSVVGGNGFRYCYTSGTVTFKDSTITGSTYGIHFDGNAGGNIVIENCVITGWTSFARTINKVTMTDITFAEGNYNYIRFYQDADITGCTFNENMKVDVASSAAGANVTVTDSTVENGSVEDLFADEDLANCTVMVEGERLMPICAEVGEVKYRDLQQAIDAAGEGDTVTVLYDIALAEGIVIAVDDKIVLDLNGKTISRNTDVTISTAAITNDGTLTIKDSVGGGKITAFAANPDTAETPYYASNTITNCGVLNVEGGTIENSTGDDARAAFPIDNNSTSRDAIVNISGGTVTGRGAIRQFANSTTNKNEVNISGGTVTGTSYGIWVQNPGSGDPVASLNISGGTVAKVLISPSSEFDVSITGGTISDIAIWEEDTANTDRNPSGFITGGSFKTVNAEKFLAEGYELTYANGLYSVKVDPIATVGGNDYISLQDAIDAAEASGATVYLKKDVALGAPITVDGTVILDLNSFDITYISDVVGEAMITITNTGDLTITDSSANADGKISYTYTGDPDTNYSKMNTTIQNQGKLTIKSGTVENTTAAMKHASYAINTNAGATLNVEGGKVLNLNGHAIRQVSFGTAPNTVNITDGYVEGTRAIQVQIPGGATATTAPEMTLNITGGELKSNESTYNLAVYVYSNGQSAENVTLSVSDGTINGNIALNSDASSSMKANAASVTGGTLNGAYGIYSYAVDDVAKPVIAITGGTFATNYAEKYAEDDGYGFQQNDDGTYRVDELPNVAQIGETGYKSLQAAVNAAQAGDTVTLLTDVTLTETLTIPAGKTVTLDLAVYTITGTPTEAKAYSVITNKGNLTIIGNGSVVCDHQQEGSTAYAVNTITNSGTLTIESGTIENKSTASNQIGYAIDNNSTSGNAVLTIKSGTVTASGSGYYDGIRLFCNSENNENSVTVENGTVSSIWMQNPSDGTTDKNTKNVKGAVTISGGTVNALYLEPSTAFTASITGGNIGSVSYFQTSEGRDLTGFITGGTFAKEPAEALIADGYEAVENEDGSVWTVQQEAVEEPVECPYDFGQTSQIWLIEPWALRANLRLYHLDENGNRGDRLTASEMSEIDDFGVYFVRESDLGMEDATVDNVTIEDIINNENAILNSKDNNKAWQDSSTMNCFSSDFKEGIYTYQLSDSIFVLYYVIEDGQTYYAPIRERNLSQMVEDGIDDTENYSNTEREVFAAMHQLEKDILIYRGNSDDTTLEIMDAPTLAEHPVGTPAEHSLSFGHTMNVSLVEPWGIQFNGRVALDKEYDDYGVIVYYDTNDTVESISTPAELLAIEDAYVFSYQNGDATISIEEDGRTKISALYNSGLYTYQMKKTAYVMFYVQDGDSIYCGPVRERSIESAINSRLSISGVAETSEGVVLKDMLALYQKVAAHRGIE